LGSGQPFGAGRTGAKPLKTAGLKMTL